MELEMKCPKCKREVIPGMGDYTTYGGAIYHSGCLMVLCGPGKIPRRVVSVEQLKEECDDRLSEAD